MLLPGLYRFLPFFSILFLISGQWAMAQPCVPPPNAPVVGSNAPVCLGSNLQLSASGSGLSYLWQGPNGFTSGDSTVLRTNIQTTDAGIYSVYAIVSGCTSTVASTIPVNVNPLPAAPIGASNSPICDMDSILLYASAVPGASYSWTGPNGFTSVQQNPVINPAGVLQAGAYSVVSIVIGCSSVVATHTVVVNALPAAPVLASNVPVCSAQSMRLSADGPTGASYTWTGPNGFNTPVQYPLVSNVTVAATGIYSVRAIVSGCSSVVATLAVSVLNSPGAIAPASNTPVCEYGQINLSAAMPPNGGWYWSGPNGFTANNQFPFIPNAATVHAGNYTVYAIENGCLSAGTVHTVSVQPAPVVATLGSNSPVCTGQNLLLTASTVPGGVYEWEGPNGYTANTQNAGITGLALTDSGMYTVYVTANGCRSIADSTLVEVNQTPATPVAFVNTPACTGDLILFSTADASPAVYVWTGPTGFQSSDQNPFIGSASMSNNGVYNLQLIDQGCISATSTLNLVVNQTPILPTIGGNGPVCATAQIQLNASTVGTATYIWTGPNGYTSSQQNPVLTNVSALNEGLYSFQIQVNGCLSDTTSLYIEVVDVPMGASAGSNSPVCAGDSLVLWVTGLIPGSFEWQGPNGFRSSQTQFVLNPAFISSNGMFHAMYYAAGCTVSLSSVQVVVNPTPSPPLVSFAGGFLNSSVPLNIQWYFNTQPIIGATLPSLNPSADGYYMVQYTDPTTGCKVFSQSYFYKALFTSSSSDETSQQMMKVYPNPVRGDQQLNIEWHLPFSQSDLRLQCFDLSGKLWFDKQYPTGISGADQLEIHALPLGMYIVWLTGERLAFKGKFIKQ